MGSSESGDCGVSRDEMSSFPYGIHHIHDSIMSMCVRKFTNEVHAEDIPTTLQDGERMELSGWAPSLDLRPETDVARPGILTNVSGHLWPPVAPGDKLQGFPASRVACNLGVMVLRCNAAAELRIIWNIDAVSETQ